eukprot:scaffold63096_cov53-Phaeocystis_antarctica.AAC.1
MPYMVVTLEVFQLEMSALKFCKSWKSQLMSVMAETFQSAIDPYVAMAAVWPEAARATAAAGWAATVMVAAATATEGSAAAGLARATTAAVRGPVTMERAAVVAK